LNTRLEQLFDDLEVQREELLHKLKPLSAEALQKHPAEKWSIAQVLAHLIVSEQLSIAYLNKKMLGIESTVNTGLKEEFKMITLIVSQRLPFKFKAPPMVVDKTPVYENIDQLITAWETTRSELKIVLEKFQDNQMKRKIYKHPVAGMLNIQQALRFFGEHIAHHTPQVKNLLKQN
jgi:uncharacterized damage-inducible protein DinB